MCIRDSCQDYAPGAKAIALGNVGSAGNWVVNGDGTISPHDGPHLVLGWGDFTTASGSCGADNMNMDPQPNNLVLMDSAMALGCEAAREADPAQMCAPVFRARGVDCNDGVTGSCTELSGVQRDLCEWHDVAGMGSDAAGLDACRAWCDAEASCFAIQWVPGESWCNPCTGWANDQGVDSMSSWAATSGDAEVQSKAVSYTHLTLPTKRIV